jgi:hypothetical protein
MKTRLIGEGARLLPFVACGLWAAGAGAGELVACHYAYGGEENVLLAHPVASPYRVGSIEVGSYFRLRVVFRDQPSDQASIKVYVYADRDEGASPIHQATWTYPPVNGGAHGFTGRHAVYEPMRDGELEYWCEMRPAP